MADQLSPEAAQQRLKELQKRSEALEQELVEIRFERASLKKQGLRLFADFGCECDSNTCRTEKNNEPITAGETDSYCHDDQDFGDVSVRCLTGEIEVVISRAVWYTFDEYDRKRLTAGQTWKRAIQAASDTYDQTNRVELIGHADSTYNLDFKSWDA